MGVRGYCRGTAGNPRLDNHLRLGTNESRSNVVDEVGIRW